ncbi:MAG: hypothetical protein FWC47_09060 [Oscillospiraceae bacterium]|nr:hypothetical protein [Oscillospiraceae bacterium]
MSCGDSIVLSISALAIALSKDLSDDEIDILAASFTQLGDTLATISTTKGICDKRSKESN